MAKIKVHELAKELEIKSKDIISFLQEKGMDVKAAQSSLEGDAVEWVKKKFISKAVPAGEAKTAQKTNSTQAKQQSGEGTNHSEKKVETTERMAQVEKPEISTEKTTQAAPVSAQNKAEQSAAEKEGQAKDGQARPHKKAKTIIVVNNPQNSRMKSGGSGNNDRRNSSGGTNGNDRRNDQNRSGQTRNGQNKGSGSSNRQGGYQGGGRNNGGNRNPRVESRPLIRPLTKPTQPTMPDEKLLSVERAAKEAEEKALAAQRAARAAEIEAQKKAENAERAERAEQTAKLEQKQERSDRPNNYAGANRNDRPGYQNREGSQNRGSYNSGDRNNSQNRSGYNSGSAAGGQNRSGYNGGNSAGGQNRSSYNANGTGGGQNRSSYNGGGYSGNSAGGQNRGSYNANGTNGGQNRGGYNGGSSYNGNNAGGQNRGTYGSNNTAGRPGQDRTQGNGPRRDQNRPPYSGGTRDNQGYNRTAGAGRPGANGGRPQSGDGRQDNKFRKPAAGKGFTPEAPAKDTEKRRDDRRLSQQERDKKSKKDAIYEEDKAAALKKNKAGRFIKPEPKMAEPEEVIKVITVPETITIKELAEKMRILPAAIIKKLFLEGKIVTVNQEISYEDAENIAIEYDIICEREVKVDVIEELLKEEEESEEGMITRPPVICVMGHVDHGKTSLLDAIRKTNVTDREAGGITQHVGAYTVQVNGQKITFLDTPGHEAFTAMRMRGANSTDIAVLVVAADDGVMPQTVEAINHAKAAGIEIIVAVNKIDKPNANIDRVKQELTEYGLIAEDWGGSTVFAPVSAKTGEGLQNLLEMILLTAEVLELKANPDRMARGLVIEAELDKGRGPVARVLVQKGTLHVGDFVSAGSSSGKVRAMIDDKGKRVKEAAPSTPVEILGLSDVPDAGDVFLAHESDKEAKSYAGAFIEQNKEKKLEETKAKMSLDDLFNQIKEGNLKELNLIVKADVQGSVEAVKQSLLKLTNEEVVVKCIHGGVGAINESDVTLASASNAIIIGFNVRPDATAKATAELEGVDIRLYRVIYQAIEDIEAAMKGMLDPVFEEKVIGHAEVRQIFKASAIGNIAGSYVLDGMFQRGCKVRITREGEQIFEGALASLKRFKDDVKEVKAGFECGLVFDGFDRMQELDIVEAYIMVEVPR